MAKGEFEALLALAEDAPPAIAAGDIDGLGAVVTDIAQHTARAADLTGDPIWRVAEVLPWVGPNLEAVRVAAAEASTLSAILPDGLDALARLSDRPTDAMLDVEAMSAAGDVFERVTRESEEAEAALARLRHDQLVGPVANGVAKLQQAVAQVTPVADVLARAGHVLPTTLGADGERTILVMMQNPAELRSGGGITGSFAELSADSGSVSLIRQANSADFPIRETAVADVSDTTTELYGDGVGRYVQNASMTPDYAVTGALVSAWWSGLTGRSPDTVISVDPFVLRALLEVTGPVEMSSGGSLSAENAISALLDDPYRTLSPEAQDGMFSEAVEAVFHRLTSGSVDAIAFARAMEAPVAEGRVSVWSADGDERSLYADTILAGPAARQRAAGDGAFAVYFNDATGGKMAGYLNTSIAAATSSCRPDGFTEVSVSVTIASEAPPEAPDLPFSVTGGGLSGVPAGDIATNVTVTGPADSYAGGVVTGGGLYPATTAIDEDRAATTARIDLSPGETAILDFRFLVRNEVVPEMTVLHTPMVNTPALQIDSRECTAGQLSP